MTYYLTISIAYNLMVQPGIEFNTSFLSWAEAK